MPDSVSTPRLPIGAGSAKAGAPRAPFKPLLAFVLLVAGALSTTQCVLFVGEDIPEGEAHCRISGADSQCGRCVVQHCQAEVDSCCGEPSCAGTLADVESCATNHGASCTTIDTSTQALATCTQLHCGAVCVELTGTSSTACEEPPFGEGSACRCSQSGAAANDDLCNPEVFPNTLCCAPTAWPDSGLECSCRPLGCNATTDGCLCGLVDYTPESQSCKAEYCCVSEKSCACRSKPCFFNEQPVEACNVNVMQCAAGQEPQTSCSRRQ